MEHNNKDDMISGINVTPLVDITLVLLIIFMTTATLMVSPSIKIHLPKAKSSEKSPVTPFSITIDKNDNLYLNGKPVIEAEIIEKIMNVKKNKRVPEVIIAADKDVKHGFFIHIIDIVKQQGVDKFAINIQQE